MARYDTPPVAKTPCDIVEAEARKYPDWDAHLIAAISHAESHCDATRTGDKTLTYQRDGRTYGYSVSALQVRILPGREHCDTHDLATNVKCAYAIWHGQGYGAWTMYLNGTYKQYL